MPGVTRDLGNKVTKNRVWNRTIPRTHDRLIDLRATAVPPIILVFATDP
jgi:hypothetical protein